MSNTSPLAADVLYSVTVIGSSGGGPDTTGYAINNAGQVVGTINNSGSFNGPTRAFLYSNGQITDLALPGDSTSYGYGINNAGQVVGSSVSVAGFFPPIIDSAFLYSNGQMRDLNTLIDPALHLGLNEATAINDHGQILANKSGENTYLLTLIPEPSTLVLFGVALLGCGIWARCSQKRHTVPVLHK